jgi:hypothetical protein
MNGPLLEELLNVPNMTGDRLYELLRMPDMNVSLLRELLNARNMTVARLDAMLAAVGNDPPLLSRLLRLQTDAGHLEVYLLYAGNTQRSALRLEQLMLRTQGLTGDPARVEPLLLIANGNEADFLNLEQLSRQFELQSVPAVAPPTQVLTYRYTGANMPHFLDRHTFTFFDFANPNNLRYDATMWAGGVGANDVSQNLGEALDNLNAAHQLPMLQVSNPQQMTTIGAGLVRVGVRPDTPPGSWFVGQFHPMGGPGFITVAVNVLRALARLFVP